MLLVMYTIGTLYMGGLPVVGMVLSYTYKLQMRSFLLYKCSNST